MLSSRELSGGCQTRQVPGAFPSAPRPGPVVPHPTEAAWAGKPPGKVSAGRRRAGDAGGGARTTWKVSWGAGAGEGASSRRVRQWVCEPGGVCESGRRSAGVECPGGSCSASLWEGSAPKDPSLGEGGRCPAAG